MSTARDNLPGRSPHKQDAAEQAKTRIRIGRACDRCKLKKSKCDGNSPCSGCVSSENLCEYSARRRREARDWYWEMREVIDEALQSLYWACREGRGFPGTIPDETNGHVSTDAILRGLGLIPPAVDRVAGAGSASIIPSDDADGVLVRSYHPPDVTSDHRSTNSPYVAQMPSAGRSGGPALNDGIGQQENYSQGRGFQRHTLSHHHLGADGVDPRLRAPLDGDFDPAIFNDDHDGTMDVDLVGSSEGSTPSLHPPKQWKQSDGHRARGMNHENQQSSSRRDSSMLNSENPDWGSGTVPKASETLPWPGSLAAVSHTSKSDSRSGSRPPPSM